MQEGDTSGVDRAKQAAARAAAAMVEDGMALGLGSGSTVAFALTALAERIRSEGLRVAGVPTSTRTEARAQALGIPLTDFARTNELDLAIDGADEVERERLFLIKGHGGALLREKIVATAARAFVVIVDESKVVPALGARTAVPIEVAQFAHEATARRLIATLGKATLRHSPVGVPFVTDNGNFIYDVMPRTPIEDPAALERTLQAIPGVLANGIFSRPVARVFVGSPSGSVHTLEPPPPR